MKKLIVTSIILICLLTSCNFPLPKNTEVSSSVVSTRVALTLQASAVTSTLAATTTVGTTTNTPLPTPSETPTITPTPEDPSSTLGTPNFSENFASGSSFGLKTPYSDDAITMSVQNNSLLMQSSRINGGIRWRLTYITPRNQYLQGTFSTQSCSGDDFYGLVTRSPSYTDGIGYYFAITCSGSYALYRMDGAYNLHTIINPTSSSAILAGPNQSNKIGIMLKDNEISLFANGKLLQKITDDSIQQKGYFGVFQSAVETPSMTTAVTEIDEWNLP